MIEIPRSLFIDIIQSLSVTNERWIALCLFIPPEEVDRSHETLANTLIESAILTLTRGSIEGLYTRIGWMSFFALGKQGERLPDAADNWRLAHCNIPSDGSAIVDTFSKLELIAHENARADPSIRVFRVSLLDSTE
jgi:hypothetical protein